MFRSTDFDLGGIFPPQSRRFSKSGNLRPQFRGSEFDASLPSHEGEDIFDEGGIDDTVSPVNLKRHEPSLG